MCTEFSFREIGHSAKTEMPLIYKGNFIRNFDLKMPFVENQILCGIIANREHSLKNDILSFKTYLKNLNIPFGILANFGKGKLEIMGIPKV